MKNKKVLIVCLTIITLASIGTIIYMLVNNNQEENPDHLIEGIEPAKNQDILKDTTLENFNITNISLLTREGVSSFKATISNETSNSLQINKLYVVFYEGEEENQILALNNITIPSNEKTYINITSETDLSKTTKIEYILED